MGREWTATLFHQDNAGALNGRAEYSAHGVRIPLLHDVLSIVGAVDISDACDVTLLVFSRQLPTAA